MPLETGKILNNRYRIVKLLGQGGFGAVYRAWDMTLNRPCAVKENLDASPEAHNQFNREAIILANLNHPNLARVTDYFFIPGQGQYFVMDFVEGEDLQQILDHARSPLSEDQALPWIVQICDALEYLHTQTPPIIHRDIKPANIKITPQGKAMLVDFGIAKIYDAKLKTTVGARAVTPGYSPVEQYGQGVTDGRSDLYSLGATLYTLLTGLTPPDSVDIVSHNAPPPQPVNVVNPRITAGLGGVVARAMQTDRTGRYSTVGEFKRALAAAAGPAPAAELREVSPTLMQTVAAPTAAPVAGTLEGSAPSVDFPAPSAKSLPWIWIPAVGIMLMLCVALSAGGIYLFRPRTPQAIVVTQIVEKPVEVIQTGEPKVVEVVITATPVPTKPPAPTELPGPTLTPTIGPPPELRWFIGLGQGSEPNLVEAEQAVVDQFNAAHPGIHLTLEIVANDRAYDVLTAEIAAGNPPDIVGPAGLSPIEQFHGHWLDLSPYIAAADYDLSQFEPRTVSQLDTAEGQIALPFKVFPGVLFYNKQLFDNAGLNYPPARYGVPYRWPDGSTDEWNFDTLRTLAMRLTLDNAGRDAANPSFNTNNIVQYGFAYQWLDIRQVGTYWGVGSLVAADGRTAQLPDPWRDSLHWAFNGIWIDHFMPDNSVVGSAEFSEGNVFNSGRIAMALNHAWYTCCMPNLSEKWDLAAVPSYKGQVTTPAHHDTFYVLNSTQYPEQAFEVIQYLVGDAAQALHTAYGVSMPARRADQAAYFDGLDQQFPWGVNWQVAIDSLAYLAVPSHESYMPGYNEAAGYCSTLWYDTISGNSSIDLDYELDRFLADLQALFDRNP